MPGPYPFVKVGSGKETIIYREFHKSLVQLLSHLFCEYYVIVISIVYIYIYIYVCVCVCVFQVILLPVGLLYKILDIFHLIEHITAMAMKQS